MTTQERRGAIHMLTSGQVSKLLGLSVQTVNRYIANGDMKAINVRPHAKIATWRITSLEIEKRTGMKLVKDEDGEYRLEPREETEQTPPAQEAS